MKQYKLPGLCAKCGVQPGSINYTVKIEKATWWDSILFFVLLVVRVMRVRTTSYTFDVRVCPQCRQKLETIDRINKLAMPGGVFSIIAAFFAVVGLAAISLDTLINNFVWVVVLLVAGVLTSWLVPILNRVRIGSYNGTYFKFANPRFQEEFAKLNPTLVKPNTK